MATQKSDRKTLKDVQTAASKIGNKIADTKAQYMTYIAEVGDAIEISIEKELLVKESIQELFTFDDTPQGVQSEMAKLAAQIAYVGNVSARIEEHLRKVKARYELSYDKFYLEVSASSEKATEAQKKARVHVEYSKDLSADESLIDALEIAQRKADAMLKALHVKKDMLVSLDADIRAEQDAFRNARS